MACIAEITSSLRFVTSEVAPFKSSEMPPPSKAKIELSSLRSILLDILLNTVRSAESEACEVADCPEALSASALRKAIILHVTESKGKDGGKPDYAYGKTDLAKGKVRDYPGKGTPAASPPGMRRAWKTHLVER